MKTKTTPVTKTNSNPYFKSSDMGCIAALNSSGYIIKSIERDKQNKAVFILDKNQRVTDLVDKYFSNQLQVDALAYFTALKNIKNRLYNISQ